MILPLSYFALVNFQNKQREPTEDGPKLSAPHSKIRHTEGD